MSKNLCNVVYIQLIHNIVTSARLILFKRLVSRVKCLKSISEISCTRDKHNVHSTVSSLSFFRPDITIECYEKAKRRSAEDFGRETSRITSRDGLN